MIPDAPIRKILVYLWYASLSCPPMASNYANFVSRSDLVLDADHALDCLGTYLVLQAYISFCGVSDKSGAFLLVTACALFA